MKRVIIASMFLFGFLVSANFFGSMDVEIAISRRDFFKFFGVAFFVALALSLVEAVSKKNGVKWLTLFLQCISSFMLGISIARLILVFSNERKIFYDVVAFDSLMASISFFAGVCAAQWLAALFARNYSR